MAWENSQNNISYNIIQDSSNYIEYPWTKSLQYGFWE